MNFFDKFFDEFFTKSFWWIFYLLTIASFRIGVTSILLFTTSVANLEIVKLYLHVSVSSLVSKHAWNSIIMKRILMMLLCKSYLIIIKNITCEYLILSNRTMFQFLLKIIKWITLNKKEYVLQLRQTSNYSRMPFIFRF